MIEMLDSVIKFKWNVFQLQDTSSKKADSEETPKDEKKSDEDSADDEKTDEVKTEEKSDEKADVKDEDKSDVKSEEDTEDSSTESKSNETNAEEKEEKKSDVVAQEEKPEVQSESSNTHDVYTGEVHDPNIKSDERHNYRPINIMFRRKCQNPKIRIQFDRTVILKNQTFYLNVDGKNVRLVASPPAIETYDDIKTLLQIVNDISLNSCCVEPATHIS